MRKLLTTLLLCLFLIVQSNAQGSGFVVQVAAFDQYVPLDYFNSSLSGIYHFKDHNDIHKYYIAGFSDEAAATNTANTAKGLGYNARVVDMDKIRNTCSLACGMATPDLSKIKSIFFDFDKSFLRGESKRQLDQLYSILRQNPDYNVELSAHTDAKGSLDYNNALSMRRANAAKDYLTAKGLPVNRIKVSTFGEDDPIAKNEVNGQDTPQGRQYNRRVELKVYNTKGSVEPVVEEIDVPDGLKQ